MNAAMAQPGLAQIGLGVVRHCRLRPAQHSFEYPTYFLMLPMRSLRRTPCPALRRNRFGWLSFHDRDHGDGGPDALAWIDTLLSSEGVDDADGEVWLHTYPRVLGYTFKPVSFWYCHRHDGSLRAVLVEVNNTFGERHCYLLNSAGLAYGVEQRADKVFHVSPFCTVQGQYRFVFMRSRSAGSERTVARVDHDDAHGALLQTSVSGHLHTLTQASVRRAFFGMPMMTWGVIARIHWQAARLWFKRVPFVRKPPPPPAFVSR